MEIALALTIFMIVPVALFCSIFWVLSIGIDTLADYFNIANDK